MRGVGAGRTLDLFTRWHEDVFLKGGFPSFFPRVSEDYRSSPLPADCWASFYLPLRCQRTSLDPDGAHHSVLWAQGGRGVCSTRVTEGTYGFAGSAFVVTLPCVLQYLMQQLCF